MCCCGRYSSMIVVEFSECFHSQLLLSALHVSVCDGFYNAHRKIDWWDGCFLKAGVGTPNTRSAMSMTRCYYLVIDTFYYYNINFFFKSDILHTRRTLWDQNKRQVLSKSFNISFNQCLELITLFYIKVAHDVRLNLTKLLNETPNCHSYVNKSLEWFSFLMRV